MEDVLLRYDMPASKFAMIAQDSSATSVRCNHSRTPNVRLVSHFELVKTFSWLPKCLWLLVCECIVVMMPVRTTLSCFTWPPIGCEALSTTIRAVTVQHSDIIMVTECPTNSFSSKIVIRSDRASHNRVQTVRGHIFGAITRSVFLRTDSYPMVQIVMAGNDVQKTVLSVDLSSRCRRSNVDVREIERSDFDFLSAVLWDGTARIVHIFHDQLFMLDSGQWTVELLPLYMTDSSRKQSNFANQNENDDEYKKQTRFKRGWGESLSASVWERSSQTAWLQFSNPFNISSCFSVTRVIQLCPRTSELVYLGQVRLTHGPSAKVVAVWMQGEKFLVLLHDPKEKQLLWYRNVSLSGSASGSDHCPTLFFCPCALCTFCGKSQGQGHTPCQDQKDAQGQGQEQAQCVECVRMQSLQPFFVDKCDFEGISQDAAEGICYAYARQEKYDRTWFYRLHIQNK